MSQKLVVYGRPNCSWCDRAVALATSKGMVVEYRNIQAGDSVIEELRRKLGFEPATVPQIFKGMRHIGGYQDFVNHLNANQE